MKRKRVARLHSRTAIQSYSPIPKNDDPDEPTNNPQPTEQFAVGNYVTSSKKAVGKDDHFSIPLSTDSSWMTPVEKLLRDLSAAANVTVDPAFYQRLGEQGVETFVQLPRLLLALFLAGDHGFPLWPTTIRFRIHFFFFLFSF